MKTIIKRTNFSLLLLPIIISMVMISCDSFIEVDLPESQLTKAAIFESNATANAALTDVYSKIREQGILTGFSNGISNKLGNYTDEITFNGSPSSDDINFYNNILLASNTTITDYWNITYNQIYSTNAVIEGIQKSQSISKTDKDKLSGEALFLRALLHFYLVNLYGDIPYITTTDYKNNNIIKKNTSNEVYQDIIGDLKTAIDLLPPDYMNIQRVRPNQFVARALLARVYLYNGQWQEAVNMSSTVLNSNLYKIENNIISVFLKDSKETLWQLQPSIAGNNTYDAKTFIFPVGPPTIGSLTGNLVNSFQSGDLRKSNWTKVVTNGTNTWYHAYKYREFNPTPTSLEYSILFRLAEQYLIRAEARVMLDDISGAKEDLNIIRSRAGLAQTNASTKEELLNSILQERRWELFTELGHRFFDLKRSGKINSILGPVKQGWNSTDALFPIPEKEISINLNLKPQNDGY
jgi:hypothetical protein